ncbi:hypothetical protein H8R27_15375 [Flavobacterium sp. F-408]|uniref:Uncharacterized protein n=2 Tax=Flavobacterium bernardetii TaxID=2813823 RepID=A0ABR7J2F2_9FLAO|nr:hypothetical protein [Flavobacterium bernardetii]
MNELIGIRSFNHLEINDLKRDFLIFDKIFVVGLSEWKEVFEQKSFESTEALIEQKGLIPLNDFIIYNGLLEMNSQVKKNFGDFDNYYDKNKTDEIDFRNSNIQYLINEGKLIFDYNNIKKPIINTDVYSQIRPIIESKLNDAKNKSLYDLFMLSDMCHDLKVRILSTQYDESKFLAIPCENSIYNIDGITDKKQDTFHLILNDFPILNVEKLPWEEIFNFKNDPETYNSIWGLRNWISNISKTQKNIGEIEEEYRYLRNKYEQAIKLHKLKTSNSVFQTTIQTSAELIENVAKLKLRNVSDLFFKFKENKISLMETELKSEGNQFAYLFKVKEKFK